MFAVVNLWKTDKTLEEGSILLFSWVRNIFHAVFVSKDMTQF